MLCFAVLLLLLSDKWL